MDRSHDPMQRMLRRAVVALGVGFTIVAIGAFLLEVGVDAQAREGDASDTTRTLTLLVGWALLAVGPVVGLRIGGMGWDSAVWALPVVPLLAVLVNLI